MNESTQELLNDPAMVEKAFDNPELRKLPLSSPEFNAALSDESETDDGDIEDDAPAGEVNEQEDGETEGAPKKSRRSRERRIDALTAKVAELSRELDTKRHVEQSAQAQQAYQPSTEKPKFTDYNSIEDYTEALTDWKYEDRKEREAQAAKLQELEAQSKTVRETWKQKEAEVRKEHRDYNSVVTVETLTQTNPSPEARLYLGECEDGPRVVYTLLKDPDLAAKFTAATPTKQVAMLAKLEDQVSTGSDSDNTTIATRAPSPPRNLPNGKTVSGSRSLLENAGELSFDEWNRGVDSYYKNRKK